MKHSFCKGLKDAMPPSALADFTRLRRYPRDVLAYFLAMTSSRFIASNGEVLDSIAKLVAADRTEEILNEYRRLTKHGLEMQWLLPVPGGDRMRYEFNRAFARHRGAVDLYLRMARHARSLRRATRTKA